MYARQGSLYQVVNTLTWHSEAFRTLRGVTSRCCGLHGQPPRPSCDGFIRTKVYVRAYQPGARGPSGASTRPHPVAGAGGGRRSVSSCPGARWSRRPSGAGGGCNGEVYWLGQRGEAPCDGDELPGPGPFAVLSGWDALYISLAPCIVARGEAAGECRRRLTDRAWPLARDDRLHVCAGRSTRRSLVAMRLAFVECCGIQGRLVRRLQLHVRVERPWVPEQEALRT